jgi:Phage protein (N4 Gp49/phage Sf6 gene 66) family
MDLEQQIKAAGADVAPRVTKEHIASLIVSEHYFLASDAIHFNAGGPSVVAPAETKLLTFCVLVLRNGFTVSGESACASPENFKPELGRSVARENAVEKIWLLEGYLLREQLFQCDRPVQSPVVGVISATERGDTASLVGKVG